MSGMVQVGSRLMHSLLASGLPLPKYDKEGISKTEAVEGRHHEIEKGDGTVFCRVFGRRKTFKSGGTFAVHVAKKHDMVCTANVRKIMRDDSDGDNPREQRMKRRKREGQPCSDGWEALRSTPRKRWKMAKNRRKKEE